MIFTNNVVKDIRKMFVNLKNEENGIVADKSGSKTIEIINASFIADEPYIFGTVNEEWHQRELDWYISQSLNVNDIPPPIPKIWQQIADKDGFINSNYGWAIFSNENGRQFNNVFNVLRKNPDTRQAIMIYNRPSMHDDASYNGRQDFMCCQNTQHFIRDNTLISIANFRSSDAIFGYKGDVFWLNYVHHHLWSLLTIDTPSLVKGPVIWNAMSLHIYERHFKLIK